MRAAPRGVSVAVLRLIAAWGRYVYYEPITVVSATRIAALVNAVRVKFSGATMLVVAWCIQLESVTSTVIS